MLCSILRGEISELIRVQWSILSVQPKFEEYAQMVGDLSQGGFTANESEALVTLVARLFFRQHEYVERIREEDREDRERIRREDKEDRARLETKIEAMFSQTQRWVITTLTTLLLSVVGAIIIYALRVLG